MFTKISGGKGRFDGCKTVEDVKAPLHKNETLGFYRYGGGDQWEVRSIRFGRMIRVATLSV
jgi:hypothetical protein